MSCQPCSRPERSAPKVEYVHADNKAAFMQKGYGTRTSVWQSIAPPCTLLVGAKQQAKRGSEGCNPDSIAPWCLCT